MSSSAVFAPVPPTPPTAYVSNVKQPLKPNQVHFVVKTSTSNPSEYTNSSTGRQLAYRVVEGESPWVVFFPGYASDMQGTKAIHMASWCQAHNQRFLRFDYSGHGESEGRFVDGGIGQWTNDALSVIKAATTGPLILVGSSMGGWIMLLAALALKKRVVGLVGVAAAPDFTQNLMLTSLNEQQRKTLMETGVVYPPSEYVDDPFPITMKLIEEGQSRLVLQSSIELDCPVRLIHGLDDPDVPWTTSLRLAEQ